MNGAEDEATATLEFENGALGQMFATSSAFRMPWSESFMIFGDEGTMHAAPCPGQHPRPRPGRLDRRTPQATEWLDQVDGFEAIAVEHDGLPSDSGQVNELLHFAECCATGRHPLSSGRDNLETMKVVFGIYESSRRGSSLRLADL